MPNNPHGLITILLAIKSSRGESIVFHYPAEASFARDDLTDRSDSDTASSCSEEEVTSRNLGFVPEVVPTGETHLAAIPERSAGQQPERETTELPVWHNVLGLEASLLADVFTPQRSDSKFEMWIDDLLFIGNPVHLRADGTWLKRKAKAQDDQTEIEALSTRISSADAKTNDIETAVHENVDLINAQSTETHYQSPMTMFHIVFALNTKVDGDYHERVKKIYDNVVCQLAFAFTYEQARCDYVWKQAEIIMDIKRKAFLDKVSIGTVWHEIQRKSDLARTIVQIYNAISRDDIAHLLINKQLNLSLVIPRPLGTSVLSLECQNNHPFLTSAVSFGTSMEDSDPLVMPHYALLLLSDPEDILAAVPPGSSPLLSKFVRLIKPTLSFFALSEAMGMPLHDVSTLARHLIQWRCAFPIPPLHPRNIYMTNPAADMRRLVDGSHVFASKFSTVPSLPKLLSMMSRKPVPFNAFIPSKDHRTLYLAVLTWLMREKWVIEVRLFVWVKVRAEIKIKVAKASENSSTDDVSTDLEFQSDLDEPFEDSIITDPYSASVQERLWLGAIAGQHAPADALLFNRLNRYFNGKHAMEKIAVRENVHRKTLRKLLDVYEADLVKSYTW